MTFLSFCGYFYLWAGIFLSFLPDIFLGWLETRLKMDINDVNWSAMFSYNISKNGKENFHCWSVTKKGAKSSLKLSVILQEINSSIFAELSKIFLNRY